MKVDVARIVKEKAGNKAKWIPKFLTSLVSKIIHQNRINQILDLYDYKSDVDFISTVLDHLKIKRESVGIDNLNPNNRYILASNHPLGGVDGFVLAEMIEKQMGEVKVVVNDILMNVYPVKGIFLPINKHGRQNPEYARQLSEAQNSKTPILYFPAGLCSRKVDGKITDLKWNKSFVKKALEHKRDVIPVWVDSVNSPFFYNFALTRKRIGLKANIEMILLPDELFKKEDKTIRVIFGKAISYKILAQMESINEAVKFVRKSCEELGVGEA